MISTKVSFDLVGLFDFLEDVLAWVKDREGRYLWVNRAFLINYGLEHPSLDEEICGEQVLGKTDSISLLHFWPTSSDWMMNTGWRGIASSIASNAWGNWGELPVGM